MSHNVIDAVPSSGLLLDQWPFAPERAAMVEVITVAHFRQGRTGAFPSVAAIVMDSESQVVTCSTTNSGIAWHPADEAVRTAGPAAIGGTLVTTLAPDPLLGVDANLLKRLAASGIARVVVACDPLVEVNGQSWHAALVDHDIAVAVGCGKENVIRLYSGYVTRLTRDRPEVTCKFAMTADGAIAAYTKDGRGISSDAERVYTHQLRDRTDAILVGAGVVVADDPRLTTRLPNDVVGEGGPHHPVRIVVDGRGDSSTDAAIFDPDLPGETIVATTEAVKQGWATVLQNRGIFLVVAGPGPRVDLHQLLSYLARERRFNTLLVEGGSEIHGAFFDAGLVDRVIYSVSPMILGGRSAIRPVGGTGSALVSSAIRLSDPRVLLVPGCPGEIVVDADVKWN
jgi:diaminohydroxyphosphoribosylaminopyrimidine deaminase/5-amino-6-(5-phosphoribosylamino)uracil reductase